MGRGKLTAEEIQVLMDNPYVLEVNEDRIIYTEEFKVYFMQEYLLGKGPTGIFRNAGLSPAILGSKRIERCTARWKEAYYAGSLGKYKDVALRHKEKLENPNLTPKGKKKITAEVTARKLRHKQKQIQMLRAENEVLKEKLRQISEENKQQKEAAGI